jgi:hypothetical protein
VSEHRWEWILPGGERVAATLDPASGVESVFLDGRIASRAARGTKPDGYVVEVPAAPGEVTSEADKVVVTFDPRHVICILRVGREEIAPSVWPSTPRSKAIAPAAQRSFPLGIVVALLAVAAIGAAAFAIYSRATSHEPAGAMSGAHRAANGLFVAHFPTTFAARPAITPSGMSGLVLEDRERSEAIVIVAVRSGDERSDPWVLQKRVHGEALANLPRGSGAHEETSRKDGTCLGQPGAIVLGRVTSANGSGARLWSCAFHRGGAAYLAMFSVGETATATDTRRVQAVVDATELTELEDMGGRAP